MTVELPETMKAVQLHAPFDVRVKEVPVPRIEHPDDAIIRITLAGLCGSDLHAYRGHEKATAIFTMGHEFVGTVVELGFSFSHSSESSNDSSTGRPALYETLKIGDKVVSPFTSSCGECQSCRLGFSSRCIHSLLFGHPRLPGAQAQYIRVPKAGGTLFRIPSASEAAASSLWSGLNDTTLLLMADILPTGCFAALQMLQHPKIQPVVSGVGYPMSGWLPFGPSDGSDVGAGSIAMLEDDRRLVVAIVGLGPVGVCATIALLTFLAKSTLTAYRVVGIDLNSARRDAMLATFAALTEDVRGRAVFEVADPDGSKAIVEGWTGGVGCNAVLEVVGSPHSLTLSHALLRPFGVISSVGVHQTPPLPFTGTQMYGSNAALDFGRCPVRSMFPIAVEVLLRSRAVLEGLVERTVAIDGAPEAFGDFEKGRCGKVCFDPWI